MISVESIQEEIKALPKADYSKLRNWFLESGWQL